VITKIAPITPDLQLQVIDSTYQYIKLASQIFERPFAEIPINFKLSGRAAGMYHLRHGERFIRYNPYIFAKYFTDNLQHTVPHEVAHYVADILYGIKNIKPHGKEWKKVMHHFGVEARTTCNYDLQGIPQRQQRRFAYRCQCRDYELTTRRHNLIERGQRRYHCPLCRADIRSEQT